MITLLKKTGHPAWGIEHRQRNLRTPTRQVFDQAMQPVPLPPIDGHSVPLHVAHSDHMGDRTSTTASGTSINYRQSHKLRITNRALVRRERQSKLDMSRCQDSGIQTQRGDGKALLS